MLVPCTYRPKAKSLGLNAQNSSLAGLKSPGQRFSKQMYTPTTANLCAAKTFGNGIT